MPNIRFNDIQDTGLISTPSHSVRIGIRNILLTKKKELGHDPDFGCQIEDYLFELCDESSADQLRAIILDCLKQEERIEVLSLEVIPVPDKHLFQVYLTYTIKELNITDSVSFNLMRE